MSNNTSNNWLKKLLRPSPSHSILFLTTIGLIFGIIGLLTFDGVLHATSTEKFCISCHEMEAYPYERLRQTAHYNNASGIQATCSDCHVPKEFVPKIIRKAEAAREVWGTITGVVDTPEKYAAHAPKMRQREVARLRANNSQECRNCHDAARMRADLQSRMAQRFHQTERVKDKSCIDCL